MKKIYTLHKILGLTTALVFIVVCITGFFLLFRGEMAEGNSYAMEHDLTRDMDSREIWSHAEDAITVVHDQYSTARVDSIRLYESSGRLSLRCQVDGKNIRVFYDVGSNSLISSTGAVKQAFIDRLIQQFSRIHKNPFINPSNPSV